MAAQVSQSNLFVTVPVLSHEPVVSIVFALSRKSGFLLNSGNRSLTTVQSLDNGGDTWLPSENKYVSFVQVDT